jgi:hypothetical protein
VKQEKEKPQESEDQTAAAAGFDEYVAGLGFDLDVSQAACDLRDGLLELFKRRPKPWDQMMEGEQIDVAAALQEASQRAVQSVVVAVAERGQTTVSAVVESMTYKGGAAKIVLKAVCGPDQVERLAELDAQAVLIVHADAQALYGNTKPETQPDAPELFNEAEPTEPAGEEVDLEAAAEPDADEELEEAAD